MAFYVKEGWLTTIGEASTSTMWHPVYMPVQTMPLHSEDYSGRLWDFPWNNGASARVEDTMVFNFVFETRPLGVYVGAFLYAALGHGIKNDEIVSHEYFGGDQVIRDLERQAGFASGNLAFYESPFRRDEVSGTVVRMQTDA